MAQPDPQPDRTNPTKGADVFISYASPNLADANTIRDELAAVGISCWIATRGVAPGEDYRAEIISALDAATVVVVLVSSAALNSEHVAREVDLATNPDKRANRDRKQFILPVHLEPVELTGALRYSLASTHRIDAFPLLAPVLPRIRDAVHELLAKAGVKVVTKGGTPFARVIASLVAWSVVCALSALTVRVMHVAWFNLLPLAEVPRAAVGYPLSLGVMLWPVILAGVLQFLLHRNVRHVPRLDALFVWERSVASAGRIGGALACLGGLDWAAGQFPPNIQVSFVPGSGAPSEPTLVSVYDQVPDFYQVQAGYYLIQLRVGRYVTLPESTVRVEVADRGAAEICRVWMAERLGRNQSDTLRPQVDGPRQYIEVRRSIDPFGSTSALAVQLMRGPGAADGTTLGASVSYRDRQSSNTSAVVEPQTFPP